MQILVLQQPRPAPPLPAPAARPQQFHPALRPPVLPARPHPRPPVPPLRPQPPRQFMPNTVYNNYGYENYY